MRPIRVALVVQVVAVALTPATLHPQSATPTGGATTASACPSATERPAPLTVAAVRRYLSEKGPGDVLQDDGFSFLHLVSSAGGPEALRELITSGVNINVGSREGGMPPLIYAARFGQYQSVNLLIGAGAVPDVTDGKGRTALGYAAFCGFPAVVRLLLERGANVEKRVGQVTPLSLAAQGGHLEVVRILLRHGADAAARNADGSTASVMNTVAILTGSARGRSGSGAAGGSLAAVPDSTRLAIGDVLSRWPATLALLVATSRRDLAGARAAVLAGASPYERNREGVSALLMATRAADTAAVRLMLGAMPTSGASSRLRQPVIDTAELARARRAARDSASFAMLLATGPKPDLAERVRFWRGICDSNQVVRARVLQAAGATPPAGTALAIAASAKSLGPLDVLTSGPDSSWKEVAGDAVSRALQDRAIAVATFIIKRAGHKSDAGTTRLPVLHWAARVRDPDILKLALDAGVDPTRRYEGQTPLDMALEAGDSRVIALLRSRGPAVDPRDHVLLLRATAAGDVELVRQFMRVGADLLGSGAFERAVANWMPYVAAEMLTDARVAAEMRRPGPYGHWRLVDAMKGEGRDEMVRLLVSNGAKVDLDSTGPPGQPIVWAARRNKPEAIAALVQAGARVRGPTPVNALLCQVLVPYVMERRRVRSSYGFVVPLEGIVAVLAKGAEADPPECDLYGTDLGTPLHVLAAGLVRDKTYDWQRVLEREQALLEALVAAGVNVEARTRQGKTPIDLAKARHDDDMVQWLKRARK